MRCALLVFILSLSLLTPAAFAEISTPPASGETFETGDYVDLSCSFNNDLYNDSVNLTIETAFIGPGMGIMPSIETFELAPSESVEISDFSFPVTDTLPSGSYSLVVNIIKDNELVEYSTFDFNVQGTTEKFAPLNLLVCADLDCDEPRKVHNITEGLAFVRVFSTDSPELAGTVLYPDGTTEEMTFIDDFGEVWFNQLGTYELYILASKEGYESETLETDFRVVKGDSISFGGCADESDGVCDEDCPYGIDVDCYYTEYEEGLAGPLEGSVMNAVIILAALILVVVVLILIMMKVVRSREPPAQRAYMKEDY